MREVAAEFANPVMLYSIDKDSGVMLHVALKAFFPSVLPFPLLHIDTGWKFRDMIAHRDRIASRYGVRLIVHINEDGVLRGINPLISGSRVHTQVMKTDALKRRTVDEVLQELYAARQSERSGRLIDTDETAAMERKKRGGYF